MQCNKWKQWLLRGVFRHSAAAALQIMKETVIFRAVTHRVLCRWGVNQTKHVGDLQRQFSKDLELFFCISACLNEEEETLRRLAEPNGRHGTSPDASSRALHKSQ